MNHEVPFEHVGPWPAAITAGLGVLLLATFVWSFEQPAVAAPTATAPPPPAPSVVVVEKPVPVPVPVPSPSTPPVPVGASAAAPVGPCAPHAAIPFAAGQIDAPADAKDQLEPLVVWALAHPEATLLVDGHADATGAEETNVVLSHHRARAIALLLEGRGIAKTRLNVRAFGAYQPLEGKEELAADNRRVHVQAKGFPVCPKTEKP